MADRSSRRRIPDRQPRRWKSHLSRKPVYTDEARSLKLEGEVLLEVMFGANGTLHVNRVVRGLGHGLDEAAIAAANKMRFKPALRMGQPVDSTAIVHVLFQIGVLKCAGVRQTLGQKIRFVALKVRDESQEISWRKQSIQRKLGSEGTLERRVMRTWKWMFTAALLVSVSAAAQQPSESQPSAQPNAAASRRAASADASGHGPDGSDSRRSAAQPQASQSQQATAPAPTPSTLPAPTTMDQVVDRFIEREHALMKALANRTPVVETYLQNLTADPQLGPVPSGDHYFLGRMDMGETVDRKDYLKDQDKGAACRAWRRACWAASTSSTRCSISPLGFSWMVYADRTDFDRSHYEFHYVRREFLGDVRCLVFDVTPKKNSGQRTLPRPHLGGRPGLQHRAPQRNLRSGAAEFLLLPHG